MTHSKIVVLVTEHEGRRQLSGAVSNQLHRSECQRKGGTANEQEGVCVKSYLDCLSGEQLSPCKHFISCSDFKFEWKTFVTAKDRERGGGKRRCQWRMSNIFHSDRSQ